MSGLIIKVNDDDEDHYILWSTVVEAPTAWGTQAELTAKMRRWGEDSPDIQQRFNRARKTGTSMFPWKNGQGGLEPGFYAFGDGDQEFIVEQRGVVRRHDLPELCRCLEENLPYPHILRPFPDGYIRGWKESE